MAVRTANIMAARGPCGSVNMVLLLTFRSCCRRNSNLVRPKRHGQDDSDRQGGDNHN